MTYENLIQMAFVYWIVLNFLVLLGGFLSWFQIWRLDDTRPSSKLLRRVLMAEALRGGLSLWAIRYFQTNMETRPGLMVASTIVITLVTGAIWGWLLYTLGWTEGRFRDLFWQRGGVMDNKKKRDEEVDEQTPKTHPTPDSAGKGPRPSTADEGDGPAPPDPGVGSGPGRG